MNASEGLISPEVVVAKDTSKELEANKTETHDHPFRQNNLGIRLDDVLLGLKLAFVSITDDKPGTLKKKGKTMPWHVEAVKMIIGGEDQAACYEPLSTILENHCRGLKVDHIMDVTSFLKSKKPIDTQGFIAHNDEIIVLSYQCSASFLDWITNVSVATTEWKPETDLALGQTRFCSFLRGRRTPKNPRVHTGFYNNFIATGNLIQKYIEPLLQPDQPPRKLYVVGHSLGAGIAVLATSYFLSAYNWETIPHNLVCVTAGCPRSVNVPMLELIEEKMNALRPLNKAVICRVVLDNDVVPKAIPTSLGYAHVGTLVHITNDGNILINPDQEENVTKQQQCENMIKIYRTKIRGIVIEFSRDDDEEEEVVNKEVKYEDIIKLVPEPLKNHMPDFYLKPFIQLSESESVQVDH